MKKTIFYFLLTSLFFVTSCSNDFDVTAEWKDIPVVYGTLSLQDEAHYIRVEKAFLDPKSSALDIARNPDSLYYANATVQLERVSNGQVFTLSRVDGNLEGLVREDGIFAESPNWLYKISSAAIELQGGEVIRLLIDRGNGLPVVTAQTIVQEEGVQRGPTPGSSFNFVGNDDTVVRWSSPAEAKIFDVKLILRYVEVPKDNSGPPVEKSIEWQWAQGKRFEFFEAQYTLSKPGTEFFEVLANSIPEDETLNRFFQGIDVEIISGGEALEKYINVALANSGITGSQEIPSYTNLSEGLGIFSSINYLVTKNYLLTATTRDSLRNGSITGHLNFL